MTRLALILCGLALLVPVSADATLRMNGDVRPRHWNWARAAQANVPLADLRITLDRAGCLGGGACYEHHGPGRGYLVLPPVRQVGYMNERFLFIHELGHGFDFQHLNRDERDRIRATIGTQCSWWSQRCFLAEGYNVPPGEMFAEMYAFCALDLVGVDLAGYYTYGWLPSPGTEAALCSLIRSFV